MVDKTNFIIILGLFFVISVLGGIVFKLNNMNNEEFSFNTEKFNIAYIDLNKTEIDDIEFALWDLQDDYQVFAKEVLIASESTKDSEFRRWIEVNDGYWRGVNINNGEKILILYDGNPCELRVSLCHELIHSMLDEKVIYNEEDFTYSLSKKGICYANANCDYQNGTISIYQQKINLVECKNNTEAEND